MFAFTMSDYCCGMLITGLSVFLSLQQVLLEALMNPQKHQVYWLLLS